VRYNYTMNARQTSAPLMLSISGLRGVIGDSLTPPVAARYAAAAGSWLKAKSAGVPRVVIGRDSRPSGAMIGSAAAAGLAAVGCQVVRLGLATTPSVAVMVQHLNAAGGMVVTASHNPLPWNGLKTLTSEGVAPPTADAQSIIDRFKADDIDYADVSALQPLQVNDDTNSVHVDKVLAQINVAAIRQRRLKVVLDSVCGAGGPITARLLHELGVELVHLHAEPSGLFPHPPEPTRENLTTLCDAVRQHKADIGFAQDPDADRLAVVDEQGGYIGEEYTLALAVLHVLTSRPLPAQPCVATNLSTSRMIDDIAAAHGAKVLRTPVGEANVAAAMRASACAIGGEGNGGVMWPPVVLVRDSLTGIALILEMLALRQQPLSAITREIPAYCMVKEKFPLRPGQTPDLRSSLIGHFPAAASDTRDGVRLDWRDRWVHVRPSNTEPIIRVIAEANTQSAARQAVAEVAASLGLG
jgi:phosphomannomutase